MFSAITLIHYFFDMSLIHYVGDIGGMIGIGISLFFIRKSQIKSSSRVLLGTMSFLIFVYGICVDLLAEGNVHFLRMYVSLFGIMGVYIIMLTLFSATTNFKFYIGIFNVLLILHFITIVQHNGGIESISNEMISYSIISIIASTITGLICLNMSSINNQLYNENQIQSEKLKDYTMNLNDIVERQTRELRESNERLQKYAHIASHDLKEPLRSMSSFIGIIKIKFARKYPWDDSFEEYFNIIIESTKRMNDLIGDILTFAKISSSKEKHTVVDLNQLVLRVKNDLSILIKSKKAQLKYGNLSIVLGQENLLFQVFLNIIANAILYSREGVAPIIEIASIEAENKKHITIQDNGIGIAPNMLEKIFLAYTQSGNANDGIGMGLAVCKNIVEFHGG